VSIAAIVLLAAALVLLGATEWPRLARRVGLDTKVRRERKLRKSHLRIVKDENDDFAKAVERDLAALPTIDDRD
jgi:Sec-independent protein translocase protein TatA